MVGRVLLNASGLKVSKPGNEVTSTGPGGLQFSSDWAAFGQYMSGSVYVAYVDVGGNRGRYDGFISFGKTFATRPVVWFYLQSSGGLVPVGNASGFTFYGSDGALPTPRTFGVVAQVGTTGITITGYYDKVSAGWPVPLVLFNYYVFEYNL